MREITPNESQLVCCESVDQRFSIKYLCGARLYVILVALNQINQTRSAMLLLKYSEGNNWK